MTSHRGRPSRAYEDGLEVVRQWRPPERPFNRSGFPPGTSHALPAWLAVRRGGADVVHAWTAPSALAANRSGKPSVFAFQGVLDAADLDGRPRVRSMLMRAARGAGVVTAYSQVAADAFEEHTGIAARAIEPGIRLDAFSPGGERHRVPAIFCAADPGEARKRVPLLIEAFARIRATRPDAELWLMPGGAARAGDGIRIVDPGADRDALIRLYRSAWISVLPAFREAFGLVVVESLACGTPVVAMSDGGAAPGLVDPALLAEPDVESLASTLIAALGRPHDPVRSRALAERHSIERCAERFEALYRELV